MPGGGKTESAADYLPDKSRPSLKSLRDAAEDCKGCELYKNATQTVFGGGAAKAKLVFIGEQPGDQEDREGKPFVGPAGRMLDKALLEAGIDRKQVYVTNAVKHFNWEPRGKRRLHARPKASHIQACRPWLEAEIGAIKPQVIACLGSVAAQAVFGSGFRVTRERGKLHRETDWAPAVVATVHPSSILRAPDDDARREAYAAFVADLKVIAKELKG